MLPIEQLQNLIQGKKVAFIGAGVSHKRCIEQFVELGAQVTLCDQKKSLEDFGAYADTLRRLHVRLSLGEHYTDGFAGQDIIMRTPGYEYYKPELQAALQAGTKVTSEVELFFELCPCEIVAVTGSDGKTTTTTLISKMFEAAGRKVFLGGNIGAALLPQLPDVTPADIAVVELSSFQLISMHTSPNIAVVTNVTPNHLDHHKDMQEYIDAKRNLSVQIHPDIDDRSLPVACCGKWEAWLVLRCEPNAGVYLGIKPGTTRQQLYDAANNAHRFEDILQFCPVKCGDLISVPPRIVHALGAGLCVLEPQVLTPGKCPISLRIYDWHHRYDDSGDLSPHGLPRQLHVDEALALIDTDPRANRPIIYNVFDNASGNFLHPKHPFTISHHKPADITAHSPPIYPHSTTSGMQKQASNTKFLSSHRVRRHLRAIGASKSNVSSMFNAETVIIGLSSGLVGVAVTYLLCIPINAILHELTGIANLSARLPIQVALLLVVISMVLTLLSGLIPSRSAARKDPVVALRTE